MIGFWERHRLLRAMVAAVLTPASLIYMNYEKGDAFREIHIFVWTAIAFALFWQEKHVRRKVIITFFKVAFFPIILLANSGSTKDLSEKHKLYRKWDKWDELKRRQW